VIKPTPDHEFYLSGKWVEAKDLKVYDELLDLDLKKVKILSIEELAGDTVYNFTVRHNHNYFAENILVHNTSTDYDKEEVVLKMQIYSLSNDSTMNTGNNEGQVLLKGQVYSKDSAMNMTDNEIQLNRLNQLEAMSRSANDLIQITKTDQQLITPVKNFALQRIEEVKRTIDRRIESEKMELVYNRPQGKQVRQETNQILNALINSDNNEMQDFQYLVQLGYGGKYTMKELERDKEILQYLLGGEFAIQRSASNPLLWMAYPLTQSASFMVDIAYKSDSTNSKGAQAAGIVGGGGAALGIVGAGIAIGGTTAGLPGAAIGLILGALGGGVSSLAIIGDLQKLKEYQLALNNKAERQVKDKIINIPIEFDYQKPLTEKPNFVAGNDLTDWFKDITDKINSSAELKYMKSKNGTKEQWALYLELFRTHGSWDIKEYLSPARVEGAYTSYVFNGIEIPQDLFGNVFIGYTTQRVGLSLNSALLGAGIFQIADHINQKIPNTDLKGAEVSLIGSKEEYRDDGQDPIGLKAGYELAQKCGDKCSIQDITNTLMQVKTELSNSKK